MRSLADRVMANVAPEPNTGCWLWSGTMNTEGYGVIKVGNRQHGAHRLVFELLSGSIPAGLFVLHRCDVRLCVNPDHMFLGKHAENNEDMITKGRHGNLRKTHCKRGHEFTEKNTRIYVQKRSHGRPSRECRICRLALRSSAGAGAVTAYLDPCLEVATHRRSK